MRICFGYHISWWHTVSTKTLSWEKKIQGKQITRTYHAAVWWLSISFVFLYRHATNRPCLATAGYFCIVAWLRCAMERWIRTRRCLYTADHLAANVPEALTVCLINTQLIDCGIVMWKYCETLGGVALGKQSLRSVHFDSILAAYAVQLSLYASSSCRH